MKWGCTVLTVLLLVVWVGSAWWEAGFGLDPTGGFEVNGGRLLIGWIEPWSMDPDDGWWFPPGRHSSPFKLWFKLTRDTFSDHTSTTIFVPIWSLVLLSGVPTVWLWYRDRRRRHGLCANCGYDLRGSVSGVCPECGTPPPSAASFALPQDQQSGEGVL